MDVLGFTKSYLCWSFQLLLRIYSIGMCAIFSHKYCVIGSHSHVYVMVIYRNIFIIIPTVAKNRNEVINFSLFFPSTIVFIWRWGSYVLHSVCHILATWQCSAQEGYFKPASRPLETISLGYCTCFTFCQNTNLEQHIKSRIEPFPLNSVLYSL